MVLLYKACHLSLLQVPPRYYTLSLDLSYTDRQWLWGWQCRPRLKHPVQTRSQRPPSLIPTSSPCSPDTGIATWHVLGRRGTKIHIPASFAKLSVCHLGNTGFVGADHTDSPQRQARHRAATARGRPDTRSNFRRGRPFSTAHTRASSKPRTKTVVANCGLSKVFIIDSLTVNTVTLDIERRARPLEPF